MKITFLISFCFLFLLNIESIKAQHTDTKSLDSIDTPFKKGRWLTGLDGIISSSTSEVAGIEGRTTTNQYGLNLTTGKFIKNRLLFGGTLQAQRSSSSGIVERATETLFVGPLGNYYLSNNKKGALFIQLAPGYVRYLDEAAINQVSQTTQINSEGNGFGAIIGVGYSYVINDRIAFDLAFNVNNFWITVDTVSTTGTISDTITVSDTLFSFGFNVLLDDFFF